jgi:hypothetical protein
VEIFLYIFKITVECLGYWLGKDTHTHTHIQYDILFAVLNKEVRVTHCKRQRIDINLTKRWSAGMFFKNFVALKEAALRQVRWCYESVNRVKR